MSRSRSLPRWLALLVLLALPTLGLAPARAVHDPIIAAAGDIACDLSRPPTPKTCQQAATAALIASLAPDAVLALGDLQYPCGSAEDFAASYDQSWGAFKAITYPVPGNHEYNVGTPGEAPEERDDAACATLSSPSDAAGYFGYFGKRATPRNPDCRASCGGYYAFSLGAWRIIALNSNCKAVGCAAGSQQETWLKAELAAHPAACTLAFWHHPRFSSGVSGDGPALAAIWRDLDQAGVDLALAGHDHDYERFEPLDADGYPHDDAMTEIVVGTGGADHHGFNPAPEFGSAVRIANQFGVLELTLRDGSYDWAFLPIGGGAALDAGHAACRPAPSA